MVLLLISSVFIIPVLIGWGKLVEPVFGILFEGISGKVLSGILAISLLWTVITFFSPLNIYIEIPTLLLGLFFFFRSKLYMDLYLLTKSDSLLFAGISLVILLAGSFYPYILDHFGYYVPTIKWLTEYGLIKGISNLDLTLGQMSIWHIFQAGFSNFSDPFLRINTVLLIIYTLYSIEKKHWIHLCFLPVLFMFSQSPSPDLPVIVFALIIVNEILSENKNTFLLFAFSVFVFAIKPTMIWLPLLVFLWALLILKSGYKKLYFGILILLLFFIKNLWTFGYPVFPVATGDLELSWKPNPEVLKISSQYAVQKTYDMQYSYEEIQKFSTFQSIRNWLFLDGIKSKINILFILSLLVFSLFAWIKKRKLIYLICISIFIKSIIVLIFSAQYRFFIDVFFVIFFILFYEYFNRRTSIAAFTVLSVCFISALSFPVMIRQYIPSFRLGSFLAGIKKEQFYKPLTYKYLKFNSFKTGNLYFNVSKNYPYNFDTPIPSISPEYISDDVKAGIFPQLLDKNDIKKGFIWKNMTPEEKKEAEWVIYTIKKDDK